MLRIWSRQALIVILLLIIASCSGGGCSSGCASCGVTPLAGGFPKADAVPNAAQIRVTRPGLDFLQANIGTLAGTLLGSGGALNFAVPASMTPATGSCFPYNFGANICPNGPMPNAMPPQCEAEISLAGAKLKLNAITPHSIKIAGTIPVRLQDLPLHVDVKILCIPASGDPDIGIGNGGCNGSIPNVTPADIPVDIELPLIAETISPREGYMKVDAANAVVNVTIDKSVVQICGGGFIGAAANALKGTIVGQFTAPLVNQIKSALQSQLCTKPNPMETPQCPIGSMPDMAGAKCVYTADPTACVPTMLGTDGHMNLGSFLKTISPGTAGGLDFMLAANGDMDPAPGHPADANGNTDNGMTLSMFGGAAQQPATTCVPIAANPVPMGIPIPDEMVKDQQTPWPTGDTGPDLGVALAGRFLNYSFVSLYNSGLLCLGVSTEQFQQLNSGYLSLIVPSIKKLTFEGKPQSAAIATRPQAPPIVKVGGGTDVKKDPLLSITLPKFAIDFYVWNYDRFVRIFTFTADVVIPLNLTTAKDPKTNPNGGLLPTIGDLVITNPVVTNADLLTDDPKSMAGGLQGLLGGIVGQFIGGGIKPIDLSTALKSLGLAMTIPAGGIRKLTKGTDDFLAIFADLKLAGTPAMLEVDTSARLLGTTVHPEAMTLETANRATFPTLHVAFSSPQDDGTRPLEYSYWLDQGTRSEWTTNRDVVIDNDYLLLQGKHVLSVVARVVGEPSSEDSTPAEVPYLIDTLAPHVSLEVSPDHRLTINAWDIVTSNDVLVARYRSDGSRGETGAWTAWMPLASVAAVDFSGVASVDVEVKDEAENVGTTSSALIRGRPDPSLGAAGSGCGCSAPGSTTSGNATLAWGGTLAVTLALAALSLRRRRRGAHLAAIGAVALVAASSQGCACGSNDGANGPSGTGCGQDCNQPCGSANTVGLVGAYTSVAKATDGTIWVSGYNDADVVGGNLWGDLVVGKYDAGKSQVTWTTVDGLPPARTDGSCPPNDPKGWRGGEADSGDDVGLWTSLALGPDGTSPMVSYYDATHQALKFASFDGTKQTWSSHTVVQVPGSDLGRYAKMLVVNGNPVIAFLVMEKGNGGKVRSKVTLAKASAPVPQGGGDWAFEDAAVDENGPCRAAFCGAGQMCIKETGTCQPTVTGCTPACAAGSIGTAAQACVTIMAKATCGTVIDDKYVESYPNALGDYVSLANGPNGLGIALYDRLHGNLVGVSKASGKWTAITLDGETGSRANNTAMDTGDVGVAASLAIAQNGDWHISYVNGFTEALQYMLVGGGTKTNTPEIVDDGRAVAGQAFGDGQHIVGDDSKISIDGNGLVTIAYQDATSGTLHVANGAPATGIQHKWSVKAVIQAGKFAGYFPQSVPGSPELANWWRQTDHATGNVTGDVSFVTP